MKKQQAQGGYFKEKNEGEGTKNELEIPDNFRLLRTEVEVYICGNKGQIIMLTDRTVYEFTPKRIVPTFSGILNKYVKFEDITVGIIYPTQAVDHGILSLSDRDF